jgi:hypothetical protein
MQAKKKAKIPNHTMMAERALIGEFMLIVGTRPKGFEFSADDIYTAVAAKVNEKALTKALSNKCGAMFRKLKSLGLISQTGLAVKSKRNSGSLLELWRVGPPINPPLNPEQALPTSDFSGEIEGNPLPPLAQATSRKHS